MTFEELGVREDLLMAIMEMGFESPMPVQERVIPHLLHEDGEDDEARKLIARAVDGNFSSLCPVSREEVQALQKEIG